jgi:acyl-CoA synthetase (AMP-forming)/AMP-acid ligase II
MPHNVEKGTGFDVDLSTGVSDESRAGTASARPRHAGLLDWLDEPRADAGARAARCLLDAGLRPGGTVVLGLETGPDFFAACFGTLIAGGTPCTVPTIALGQTIEDFVDHVASIMRVARPDVVLAETSTFELLHQASDLAGSRPPIALTTDGGGDDRSCRRPAAPLGLVQFTSGSTGAPRGVQLTYSNLEANIDMIRGWLRMQPGDATASWLPLYHDMGLIGTLLTPTVNQSDSYLMKPTQFVQRPLTWLDCFGRYGARITAAPPFCLSYLVRALSRPAAQRRLVEYDLTGWEVLILGAERIDPRLLGEFARLLEPFGFDARAFMPAYGLAEATLAVTGVRLEHRPTCVEFDPASLDPGRPVTLGSTSECTENRAENDRRIVSCGAPLEGITVTIIDDHGAGLPEGHLGEIAVEGPSVSVGYRQDDRDDTSAAAGGRLGTGDAGWLLDGELYVVGRMGDSIKVRGRTIYLQDLEQELARIPGARAEQFTMLPEVPGSEGDLVLLAEAVGEAFEPAARKVLRQQLGPHVRVRYAPVPRGTIRRTSSGKPRRRVIWGQMVAGDVELVDDVAPEPSTGVGTGRV